MITANPVSGTPSHDVTEPDVCAELDMRLTIAGVFKVFDEVPGTYLQPRLGAEVKDPRIDRLLWPNVKLIDAGWRYGAIGIECKAPGKKLGPAITQCMDYTRAAFRKSPSSVDVVPRWVFLWPMEDADLVGDLASVMDNHRIGAAIASTHYTIQLKTASGNMLTVDKMGVVRVGTCRQGNKTGSR